MTKIKYTMTATIPTVQYGNIQPSIEVEAETLEEAQAATLPHIEALWAKYGNKPLETNAEKRASGDRKLVKDIFGNEIFYDDVNHIYTNSLGEIYLSGSEYAGSFEEEFDGDYWASEFVTKYGLKKTDKQKILDMWETNGSASRSFGTALHAAIELYGTYREIADIIDMDLKTGARKKLDSKTEKNSSLSKLPYLKEVVKQFFTPERLDEKAVYEVLVVDHKNKRAGRIDRLLILDDGSYEVRDMKTNNKMAKKDRDGYAKQLSFYGDLIVANGKQLGPNPTMLHHWDGKVWKDVKLEKINTL
jgi:hypothetical protein